MSKNTEALSSTLLTLHNALEVNFKCYMLYKFTFYLLY